MIARLAVLAAWLAAVCVGLCCSRLPSSNVLIVTLDTTRADRIGCYGYEMARTPVLDRLASEGVLFKRCYSPAPVTLAAHASLFTGLYPLTHGVHDNGIYRLEEQSLTLAEILNRAGFKTAAFIGAYVLASRFGLAQGFDHYDERFSPEESRSAVFIVERRADKVTDAAIEWLKKRRNRRPFAIWLHYFDPHAPYAPPSPYDSIFSLSPYDGEIAFTDRELGRFLSFLKSSGEYDNTLILVVGDHGEALGEHGEPTHGIFLYNCTIRVPFILRLPGGTGAGMKIEHNVSLVDLVPTVLDYFDLDVPEGVQGKSLLGFVTGGIEGEAFLKRELYLETRLPENTFGWHSLEGMVFGGEKYIEAPEPELYDLRLDPGEEKNLAALDTLRLRRTANRYRLFKRTLAERRAQLSGRVALDAESAQRLRALGYISTVVSAQKLASRPDPKTMTRTLGKFMAGVMAEAEGRYNEALVHFDTVLEEDPDNIYALLYKGFIYMQQNKPAAAVTEFKRAVEHKPDCPANFLLGLAWLSLDSLDAARVWLERTIEFNPSHARANALLAEVLLRQGKPEQAFLRMEAARRLAPQDKQILNDLGKMLLDRGQTTRALRCFEDALSVDSLYPLALYNMGIACYRLGRLEDAERNLRLVAASFRGDEKVQNNLGVVLAARGKLQEARAAYEQALAADSTYAPAFNNLGNIFSATGKIHLAEKNYLRALSLDSTYAQASFNLGLLYYRRLEEPQLARRYLKQALDLGREAPWRDEARKILKKLESS